MRFRTALAGMTALAALSSGCATTSSSGDQVANSVYATHRIAKNLETDLGPRITQLNETAAELTAKVEASETTTRQLQTKVEENQAKLEALQESLDRLATVIYQEFGRSGPRSGAAPGFEPPVVVTPPAGGAEIPPAAMSEAPVPEAPPAGDAASNALTEYNKAQQAFLNDDYEQAIALYDGFLQRYPTANNAANAQFWKAESFRKLGQNETAIAEFEKVRSNYPGPDNLKAAYSMTRQADCHIALGQTQRAIELWTDLVENYPLSEVTDQARERLRQVRGN
ncbi:MAG: tetratricopeptide repeat protein [Candidatus Hydrogenedentes bacterium]|nr:tetratricopeptide repeat protein [Candidatus Hydrogenedentota bacterium]